MGIIYNQTKPKPLNNKHQLFQVVSLPFLK